MLLSVHFLPLTFQRCFARLFRLLKSRMHLLFNILIWFEIVDLRYVQRVCFLIRFEKLTFLKALHLMVIKLAIEPLSLMVWPYHEPWVSQQA